MRAITHDVAPGLRAEVRMEGGEFEMEDQRNWTDASFKSYSPPLQHPRPIRFLRGTPIRQRIGVRIVGQSAAPVAPASPRWESPANVEIRVGAESSCRLPALGTLWTETTATVETVTALQRLRLSHLRVDFWAGDNMSAARLLAAASAARSLDAALELAIFARDDLAATLVHVCALLGEVQPRPRVARWLVFHETAPATPRELVLVARQVLASSAFAAPIGGGACDNFAEFNRNHEAAEISDFTVHACNPQVHAFDDVSVVETLEIQAQAVENARRLSHGKPVCVSLVTLPRRWRKGEGGAPETRPSNLMPFKGDSRHGSAFNAAWTFGSLASLARAGTASVTYFEVMGTNGLIAPPGTPLPVFETLRQVTAFGTLSMRETTSSNPLVVDAMAFEHADEVCLLVANLTAATRQVSVLPGGQLHQVAFSPFEVRMLKCERSRLLC
ncbi:MAG: hypothetical protein KBA71_12000 [Opitutaceae bacterium]|nr:hypothetical protein [Opitutaceae bacterium]